MRRQGFWIMVALAAIALGVLLSQNTSFPTSSSLNRDASGWFLARRYLESQGADVRLLDRPLNAEALVSEQILVLVQPFQLPLESAEKGAIQAHLRQGGTILFAYSGSALAKREEDLLASLGLEMSTLREGPPILPWLWWSYRRSRTTLLPIVSSGGSIRIPTPDRMPVAPESARILYREEGGDGRSMIFDYAMHAGRVVVLPAAALANATLGQADLSDPDAPEPGGVDLLASLAGSFGDLWAFDEYHHRYLARDLVDEETSSLAWDIFLLHLALIYLLALYALGKRFGPPWQETTNVQGSTAAFLRRLGTLHHRMGHHQAAADHLVERARALDKLDAFPEVPKIDKPDDLLKLAGEVAQRQRRRSLR